LEDSRNDNFAGDYIYRSSSALFPLFNVLKPNACRRS